MIKKVMVIMFALLLVGFVSALDVIIDQEDGVTIIQNQSVIQIIVADTNSTTECGDAEFLRGDGTCQTLTGGGDFLESQFQYSFGINFTEAFNLNHTAEASINIFNQTLNTTSDVIFDGLNITRLFNLVGTMDLFHTATADDDHAFELNYDGAGFGGTHALDLVHTTGAIGLGSDETTILINIDQFLATGGDVVGLEVLTTEGGAKVIGVEVGVQVNPIEQLSGIFSNMNIAIDVTTNVLASFISTASDVAIFENDNEGIIIGNTEKFEEIEFIFDTVASGSGVKPEFFYSTGATTWTQFFPVDATNGMRNNGIILWLDSDIPTWATNGSDYLIRINRTQNSLSTAPIEDKIQIASATEYFWDKNAYMFINNISVNNLTLRSPSLLSCVGALQTDSTGNIICGSGGAGDFSFTDFQNSFSINFTEAFNTNISAIGVGNFSFSDFQDSFNQNLSNHSFGDFSFTDFQTSFNLNISGIDTNATTECGDAEFLRGDGTCQTISVGGDFSKTDFQGAFNNNITFVGVGNFSFIDFQASFNLNISGIDTNETTRFANLVGTDCGAGNLVIGIDADGTVNCVADADTNTLHPFTVSSGKIYNATAGVEFGIGTSNPTHAITVDGNLNITGSSNCILFDSGGKICSS